MVFEIYNRDYRAVKEGNCSPEFREKLAKHIEDAMLYIYYDGYSRSDILSSIIGEKVEYDEKLVNRILADIRFQGAEGVVPTAKHEWMPALVGNIVDEHEYGENHEIRRGTKQFGPGAKVYLAPAQWGDGYEKVYVIGQPRHSRKLIQVVMSCSKITNFRAQKVYSPAVLNMMRKSTIRWWNEDEDTMDALNEFALELNDPHWRYGGVERTKKANAALAILSEKYNVIGETVTKVGQMYPVVTVHAYENCISAEYYGYVREDASAYCEHYYQISAEAIAERIEKQIESYGEYILDIRQV